MKQMKRITLRLCIENAADKEIVDFLAHIDKKKYHTVNSAIKAILYEHIHGTVTENSSKTDIVSVIKETLATEIPKLLAALVSGIEIHDKKLTETKTVSTTDDDIDMSFIGG